MVTVIQQETHKVEKEHGFQEHKDNVLYIPTKLALIMSECSEALEAHRQGKTNDIGHELADIVIRTMNLAEDLGINLEEQIREKHIFNSTRPFKHGNKLY